MKSTTQTQKKAAERPMKSNVPKPEIRDNLDSRKNEEFDVHKDKVTHHEKTHHNKNKQAK